MKVPRFADFDFGNTRLRARRATFLRAADYERLIGSDPDALFAVLDDRPGPGGAGANGRRSADLRGWNEAVGAQLARSLEQMRSFYSGQARALVDLLLARFDMANVVTVIRAVAHRDVTARRDGSAAIVPIGWLSGPLALKALDLHELAAAIELFISSTPSRDQAQALHAAQREYDRTQDLAALERTIAVRHAARVAAELAKAGPSASALRRFAQREIDDHNLLAQLRLREAAATGPAAAPDAAVLPGGAVPAATFIEVARASAPDEVLTAVAGAADGRWHRPLQRWATRGDLLALHRSLERAALTDAAALFSTGNPLAIDVPLAFSAVARIQARNLRLLGEASMGGLSDEVVRRELLWPRERS